MKKYFLTFGGGTRHNYYDAVKRICNQAKEFDVFDDINGVLDKDLSEKFPDFVNKHYDFIKNNSKGYGFWIWKPYLIYETLKKMNYGDILLYLDCGCELNIHAKDKLLEYFEIVKNKKIICGEADIEIKYCKKKLLEKLDLNYKNDSLILYTQQHAGGVGMMIKFEEVLNIYKQVIDIIEEDYNYINDYTYGENEHFVDTRHDQSIISLIMKKNGFFNYDLEKYKTWYPKWNKIKIMNTPIIVARNRHLLSIISRYL